MSIDGQKSNVHTLYTFTKQGVDLQRKIEVFKVGSAKCMPAMAIVGSGEKLVGIWKKVVRGGHWAWNFPEVHGAQVVSGHSIIPNHTLIDLDKYNHKYMLSLATRTLEGSGFSREKLRPGTKQSGHLTPATSGNTRKIQMKRKSKWLSMNRNKEEKNIRMRPSLKKNQTFFG